MPIPHPLQRYWDLAAAPVLGQALDAALELGVLDRLTQPASAEEVAAALALDPARTGHLLDLLWSMDLVQRVEGDPILYLCRPHARQYFCTGQPACCADAWRYRLGALNRFGGQLAGLLRRDAPQPAPYVQTNAAGWADAARVQIGQEQRAVAVPAALEALDCVPEARQARRILDLGGGPGLIAIALAESRPDASGVVFDWPETAAVAQENIARAGLADRLAVRGGDLERDDIGQGYDLIWCSSVLHFLPDPAAALRKMRDALAPGGTLVMAHAEIPEDASAAARVLPFYLPMMMLGRNVTRAGDLRQALADCGYTEVRGFDSASFPLAPLRVLSARKAAP